MVRALMGNHTAARALVLPFLFVGLSLSACGDDEMSEPDAGTEDTGVTPPKDSGVVADSGTDRPDFGGPPDFGTGTRDAGHYCVSGSNVTVDNVQVSLSDTTSDSAVNPEGTASALECIMERPTQMLFGSIRYSGCLKFFGTPPALADVQSQLEFKIFEAYVDAGGGSVVPNDPSFRVGTGTVADRGTPVNADVEVSTVPTAECPSGLQIEFAKNGDTLRSDAEYIIRVRPTGAGAGQWVTTYLQGVVVRSEFVSGGSIAFCTPQNCFGLVDVPLVRASELSTMITAAGVNPPGAADITDYMGAGYAFVNALDCQDQPVTNAVAGFDTAPLASAYLENDGTFRSASSTGERGLYAGIGFTTTSSANEGTPRWAATGLSRDGTCTESFAGRSFDVYPDSLTIVRLGQENTLHAQ